MRFTADMLTMDTDKTSLTYLGISIAVAIVTVISDEVKQEIVQFCTKDGYTSGFQELLFTKIPYVIAVKIAPLFFDAFPDLDCLAFPIGMGSKCYNIFTRSGGKFSVAEFMGEMRFALRSMDLVTLISQMGVAIDGVKLVSNEDTMFLTLPPEEAFGNIKSQVGDIYQEFYQKSIDDLFKQWNGEIDVHVEKFGTIPILQLCEEYSFVSGNEALLEELKETYLVDEDGILPSEYLTKFSKDYQVVLSTSRVGVDIKKVRDGRLCQFDG